MKRPSTAELAARLSGGRDPGGRQHLSVEGRVASAVLLPLHEGPRGLEVWAIKRPDGLRHHAREIAFPGGKRDPGDRDLEETALREFEEELGIARARVELLGALSPMPTATSSFLLNPFVGRVEQGAEARPTPDEVAALIVAPLEDFFDGTIPWRGYDMGGYVMPIYDFDVGSMYGATAMILEELLELYAELAGLELPEPRLTRTIPWQ